MNTQLTEHTFYKQIILDAIYEDYDGNDISGASYSDKIEYLNMRITGELGWMIEREGFRRTAVYFFQGLGLNVPYMNYEIIELGEKAGLVENPTDDQFHDFVNAYWENLAFNAMKMTGGL